MVFLHPALAHEGLIYSEREREWSHDRRRLLQLMHNGLELATTEAKPLI